MQLPPSDPRVLEGSAFFLDDFEPVPGGKIFVFYNVGRSCAISM
jgi:hypothetical protein